MQLFAKSITKSIDPLNGLERNVLEEKGERRGMISFFLPRTKRA